MKTFLTRAVILGSFLLASTGAFADTIHNESGDAGQTLATAQGTAGGNLVSIYGSLSHDVDIYAFLILSDGTLFTAEVVSPNIYTPPGTLDTMLMLFNASGSGIVGNDDISGSDTNSRISTTLNAGLYYLAISGYQMVAFNTLSAQMFPGMSGPGQISAGSGTLGSFDSLLDQGYQVGSYQIALQGAQGVPDGGLTFTLLGVSVFGLGWIRRRMAK